MEITNESSEKVFAQYWPCEYTWEGTQKRRKLKLESISVLIGSKVGSAKLLLKPLSSITDEDAIEVAKMSSVDVSRLGHEYVVNFGKRIANSINLSWQIYSYLQSHGYDLPNYLLGGKTLIEAGLAIDINTLNK